MNINKRFIFTLILSCYLFLVNPVYCIEPLRVTFLDVWQGDSILIQTPQEKIILIDGGQSSNEEYNSFFDAGRDVVVPYLLERGVKHIDVLVLSHAHRDHVGGLISVLEKFSVGRVLDSGYVHTTEVYERFLELVKEKNIPYSNPRSGDRLLWDKGLHVVVLNPPEEFYSGDDACNENSLVIKVEYQDVAFLFTGDIGIAAKRFLVKIFPERLKSDVLKVSHQGSDSSFLEAFLKETSPCVGIISVGKGNHFGHPGDKILEFFRIEGLEIYRTDQDGFIELSTDGKSLKIDLKGKMKFQKCRES